MNGPHDPTRAKGAAQAAGFDQVGITHPTAPQGYDHYLSWISADFHSNLSYMARNVKERHGLDHVLPGCQSVIAVSLNYFQQPLPGGRVARYALGKDYHKVIKKRLGAVVKAIQEDFPSAKTRICVDSVPIFERELAHRAGLGWFGKNTMLIDSKRGSWFLLGFVLTDVLFTADEPSLGGCGTCTACIDACPTGAIVQLDGKWSVDARSCISALTIEHKGDFSDDQATKVGDWTFGCDICQEVCPFNTPRASQPLRSTLTTVEEFCEVSPLPPPEELIKLSESEWDVLSQGLALRRAGFAGIKRNAAANIKNSCRQK